MIKYFTTIWSDDKIFYTTIWLRYKIFAGNSRRWVLNPSEKIQMQIRQRKYKYKSDKENTNTNPTEKIQRPIGQGKTRQSSGGFYWNNKIFSVQSKWHINFMCVPALRKGVTPSLWLQALWPEKGLYRMKRVLSEQVAVQRLNNSKPDPRG